MLPVMEENGLFPVDLDAYRERVADCGAERLRAVRRVELTTGKLRALVVKANQAGLSQAELARLAGVPRVTVRDWLGLK